MAQLKFYFDTHIPKAVADQLRARGIDVERAEEAGLARARDRVHLRHATSQGRAMVSHDRDFFDLQAEWQAAGEHHSGIFYVPPRLQGQIGVMVTALETYAQLIAEAAGTLEADIEDQLIWLD